MDNSITITIAIGAITVLVAFLGVLAFTFELRQKRKMHEEDIRIKSEEYNLKKLQFEEEKNQRRDVQNWIEAQSGIITDVAGTLSDKIAANLKKDTRWATVALEEAKLMPHTQTLFGARLQHFAGEKKYICEQFLPILLRRCRYHVNNGRQVIILIDSGTTMYYLFNKLGDETVKYHQNNDDFIKNICVVTNNLPGVGALIETGRINPKNRYSPLAIRCELLPGTPLPVYSAVLGKRTEQAINQLKSERGTDTVVIGLVTGNWIRLRRSAPACPVPLARGDGHLEFKQVVIDSSDEVYIVSPLGKIFVGISRDEVNNALRFSDKCADPEMLSYSEVNIDEDKAKRTKLITTHRKPGRLLHDLSSRIDFLLDVRDTGYDYLLDGKYEEIPHIVFPYDELPDTSYEQMLIEFPHSHTRRKDFMQTYFLARIT